MARYRKVSKPGIEKHRYLKRVSIPNINMERAAVNHKRILKIDLLPKIMILSMVSQPTFSVYFSTLTVTLLRVRKNHIFAKNNRQIGLK